MDFPKNMLPLIDGDWLLYRACSAIEYKCEQPIEELYHDTITKLVEDVEDIKKDLETNKDVRIYYSGKNNFRDDIAEQKEYKGNRESDKPYWYSTLKQYTEASYECFERDGVEADDLMAMTQTWYLEHKPKIVTCIVTVDKDLRQVDGWHYSPEIWNSPSFGPKKVEGVGYIELTGSKTKKIKGMGLKFFYSQVLTGDPVDNIPGLDGCGPAAAFKILNECTTESEMYEAVRWAYRGVSWEPDECLLEQARLVWMVRGVDEEDNLTMWTPPTEEEA